MGNGSQTFLIVLSCLLLPMVLANFHLKADFPGAYCQARQYCCTHRQDNCTRPIADTLCYCDEFCMRGQEADCCPDYLTYCRNEAPEPIIACHHNGRYYNLNDRIYDNCNLCTCNLRGVMDCTAYTCLIDEALIDNVNSISHALGWTARNYSEFWGRTYAEGLEKRLGTKEPTSKVKAMARGNKDLASLPNHFNGFEYWSGLVSDIRDQGWCGSSWVMSTTAVASDRFGIMSKGKEIIELAPQHILSCANDRQACNGGHVTTAWRYLNRKGVVNEECYPYIGRRNQCRIRHSSKSLRAAGCELPTKVNRVNFYSSGPPYLLAINDTDIMAEIIESGPVQATFRVYRDFFTYSRGIYKHSRASRNEPYAYHSVRIVGWGVEYTGYETVKYWLAANSWGKWWGENGFFRIVRGENECNFEEYVIGSLPYVYDELLKQHDTGRRYRRNGRRVNRKA